MRRLMFALGLSAGLCQGAVAAQPTNAATNLPPAAARPAPGKPASGAVELAARFRIKPGFRIQLAVEEPLVADPVAMAMDENGRLFVAESRKHPGGAVPQMGRVRVLEDSKGEGIFDTSTIYADNVIEPSAIACYGGGVFVGSGSQILFLKDSRHDGLADVRRVVFTAQGDLSGGNAGPPFTALAWGLDNRIHAGSAGQGGGVVSSAAPAASIVLSGGNFAFDPRTFILHPEGGRAPTGMCFDDAGREFVCDTNKPVLQVINAEYPSARNLAAELPDPLLDISGGNTAIFPARGIASGGPAQHLSVARGLAIYRGQSFPPGYAGDVFVADAAAGVVHHAVMRKNAGGLTAARAADEVNDEFLAGRDASFQPVAVINAPDGSLLVADQVREGAPAPVGVRGTNAPTTTTSEHGRIWRILPVNIKPAKTPQLGKATTRELVAWLQSRNGWCRDTAARLLYERQDKTAVAPLVASFLDGRTPPLARMHALRALDGMRALTAAQVSRGLSDPDERVREQAVAVAVPFLAGDGDDAGTLWPQLAALASDPSVEVRRRIAFTLAQARNPGRVRALADMLERNPDDRWVQAAVTVAGDADTDEMIRALAADPGFRGTDTGRDLLRRLVMTAGAKNPAGEVARVLQTLAALPEPELAFSLTRALGDGLEAGRSSLSAADSGGALARLFLQAKTAMSDYRAAESARVEAILLLGYSSYDDAAGYLLLMFNPGQSPAVQAAAVTSLGRFDDARLAPALLSSWPLMDADARAGTVAVLLARPERTGALLSALEKGTLSRGDLTAEQISFLQNHSAQEIRRRAVDLFGTPGGRAAGGS